MNPRLVFGEAQISDWCGRRLDETNLRFEFASRMIILEAADRQGVEISSQEMLDQFAQKIVPRLRRIEVQSAIVDGVGLVTPDACLFERPCPGLRRGSTLNIKLTSPGYAGAFLDDNHGKKFLQEGRLIIADANLSEGSSSLWPGTVAGIEGQVFQLWVVPSASKLPTSSDSTPLDVLPVGTNGQIWGPVYLKMRAQQ